MIVEFAGVAFRWEARSDAWFFVALPTDLSADIREIPRMPRGFGAVAVTAAVAGHEWRTSIFPDGERGAYVLPLKRAVREAAGASEGDEIAVRLELRDG